jgi:hypothetical protein
VIFRPLFARNPLKFHKTAKEKFGENLQTLDFAQREILSLARAGVYPAGRPTKRSARGLASAGARLLIRARGD